MTGSDDDQNAMSGVYEVGGGVSGETDALTPDETVMTAGVARFVAELRALADGPAPAPSPALAALLGGAIPIGPRRLRHRRAYLIGAAAASVVAMTAVAAAHDSLPQPAQLVVAHVVNVLTPFHIDPSSAPGQEPRTHPASPEPGSPATKTPTGMVPPPRAPSRSVDREEPVPGPGVPPATDAGERPGESSAPAPGSGVSSPGSAEHETRPVSPSSTAPSRGESAPTSSSSSSPDH